MSTLVNILISTSVIALISLVGIFTFSLKEKLLSKILLYLVSLSAGALLGGALFHLLPESFDNPLSDTISIMISVFIGFILFFLVEKLLQWRHCHKTDCELHPMESFGYMNLLGDAVHNFIDGLVIAITLTTNLTIGISTVFAIFMHELPQEIGDFGVLLQSGMKKRKALLLNFLAALTVIIGGILGFVLFSYVEQITVYLLPFAAGGFLYISLSDLIPEIRKESTLKNWLFYFSVFLFGSMLMLLFAFF